MRLVKVSLFWTVFSLLSLSQAWAENENYQKGLDLYKRSDWIGAIQHFEKAAEEGVVEAQRRLGYILWKGGDDAATAGRWLKAAVDAGDKESEAYYLVFLGENVANELARNSEARTWLEHFSVQTLEAKQVLAQTYESEDDARALLLYQQLVEADHASAIRRLIKAHLNGELGLTADSDKADELAALLK